MGRLQPNRLRELLVDGVRSGTKTHRGGGQNYAQNRASFMRLKWNILVYIIWLVMVIIADWCDTRNQRKKTYHFAKVLYGTLAGIFVAYYSQTINVKAKASHRVDRGESLPLNQTHRANAHMAYGVRRDDACSSPSACVCPWLRTYIPDDEWATPAFSLLEQMCFRICHRCPSSRHSLARVSWPIICSANRPQDAWRFLCARIKTHRPAYPPSLARLYCFAPKIARVAKSPQSHALNIAGRN